VEDERGIARSMINAGTVKAPIKPEYSRASPVE
jgi:hypothetical protein